MPTNKHAQHRYAIIDECLRRPQQRWTIAKLLEAVSVAHNALTGSDQGISLRTLRNDLRDMRPGGATHYEAPIAHHPTHGYYYEDPGFSIFNTLLTGDDLVLMHQSLHPLRAIQGLGLAAELDSLIKRLEQRLPAADSSADAAILHFDPAPAYVGTQHLQPLYEAIRARRAVSLTYRPYPAPQAGTHVIHPYLLKTYNHRWFLMGYNGYGYAADQPPTLSTYALDRIESIGPAAIDYVPTQEDFSSYFASVIGITRPVGAQPELVRLQFSAGRAPYVKTKPLHPSQEVVSESEAGLEVVLHLIPNQELLTILLSFGPDMKVLAPASLQKALITKVNATAQLYRLP